MRQVGNQSVIICFHSSHLQSHSWLSTPSSSHLPQSFSDLGGGNLLDKAYTEAIEDISTTIKDDVRENKTVSLTSDGWSEKDSFKSHFNSLTAHWIKDETFELKEATLTVQPSTQSQTGGHLFDQSKKCFEKV